MLQTMGGNFKIEEKNALTHRDFLSPVTIILDSFLGLSRSLNFTFHIVVFIGLIKFYVVYGLSVMHL